jgi:hypothetical protein
MRLAMCAKKEANKDSENSQEYLNDLYRNLIMGGHTFKTSNNQDIIDIVGKNGYNGVKYFQYLDDLIPYENTKISSVRKYPEFDEIVNDIRKKNNIDKSIFIDSIIKNHEIDLDKDTISQMIKKLINRSIDTEKFERDLDSLKRNYSSERIDWILFNYIGFKEVYAGKIGDDSKESKEKNAKKASEENNPSKPKSEKEPKFNISERVKQEFIVNENDDSLEFIKSKFGKGNVNVRFEKLKKDLKIDFIDYVAFNAHCDLYFDVNKYQDNVSAFENYYYDWDSFVLLKDKFIIELEEFFSKGENAVYRNGTNYILICYYIFFNRNITLKELSGIYSGKHFDYKDYIENVSVGLDKIKKRKKFKELMKNIREDIYKPIYYEALPDIYYKYLGYFNEHFVAKDYEIPFMEDFNELYKYCKDMNVLSDNDVDYILICYYVLFNRSITVDEFIGVCKDIDFDYKDYIEKVGAGLDNIKERKKFKELIENIRKDIRDEKFSIIIKPYNKFKRYIYEGCEFSEDEGRLLNNFNNLFKYCKDMNLLADNDVDYIFLYYYVLFKRSITVDELDIFYKNRDGGYKEILEKASDVLKILKSNNDFKELVTNIRKEFGINDENSIKSIGDAYNKYYWYLYKFEYFEKKEMILYKDIHKLFECCNEFLNYNHPFDFIAVLTHVMRGEELRIDRVFDMFKTGVLKFYSGEELITNSNFNKECLYMQVPIYTTDSYLNSMTPLIVRKSIEYYNISEDGFLKIPYTFYRNKYIYEFLNEYNEKNKINVYDLMSEYINSERYIEEEEEVEKQEKIFKEIILKLYEVDHEEFKDEKHLRKKDTTSQNNPLKKKKNDDKTLQESSAHTKLISDIQGILSAVDNFEKKRTEYETKRLR